MNHNSKVETRERILSTILEIVEKFLDGLDIQALEQIQCLLEDITILVHSYDLSRQSSEELLQLASMLQIIHHDMYTKDTIGLVDDLEYQIYPIMQSMFKGERAHGDFKSRED